MDETVFEKFAETHFRGLAAFFRHRGVPPDEIKDLIQESLLLVWQERERLWEDREAAFLYGVAFKNVLTYHRKEQRRVHVFQGRAKEEASEYDAGGHSTPPPLMKLATEESALCVRNALEHLTPRQRELVELVYFEGIPSASAARQLGISRKTAATHLKRAIEQMRALLRRGPE